MVGLLKTTMKFQFINPDTQEWETICELECGQCPFEIPGVPTSRTRRLRADRRCSRNVCIGREYCFQHRKKEYGVVVKDSEWVNGGKGLFATENFRVGQFICPYGGKKSLIYPIARGTGRRGRDPPIKDKHAYLAQTNRNFDPVVWWEDAACVRGLGSLANGNNTDESNARFGWKPRNGPNKRLTLVARKPITAGTEIILKYAPNTIARLRTR
jgi:hypothetical protein